MMSLLTFIGILLTGSLLAGCSWLGLGQNDYSCSGRPDGVRCRSAREVYHTTHGGQIPAPTLTDKKALKKQSSRTPSPANQKPDSPPTPYLAPAPLTSAVPLRTPSNVMRIWIAPWEDHRGDLMVPGYVYTEIETRHWLFESQSSDAPRLLKPLEIQGEKPEFNLQPLVTPSKE